MKGVVKFFLIVFFAAAGTLVRAQSPHGSDIQVVMFWNLENFFDYIDQGTSSSDAEFSSHGARHWTKARFYAKCDAIAKMILWVGDRYGALPAVVGFAEVENGWVMRQLINNTALRKFGYRLVHYESPDSRGIDVALIYREDIYDLLDSKPCHVYELGTSSNVTASASSVPHGDSASGSDTGSGAGGPNSGKIMNTRDILLVTLRERESGEVTRFLVNHHPSKYGGEVVSRPKRLAAMTRLKSLCDSIFALTAPPAGEAPGPGTQIPASDQTDGPRSVNNGAWIIAMGDFNDTPDNPLFGIFGDTMVNKAYPLYKKGFGTIKYQGKWELIDMFIISSEISDNYRMEIIEAPFHTQRDNSHVGEKPLRTYSGPRYLGGISDHFPIVLIPSSD